MSDLVTGLRQRAYAVYLAAEAGTAKDLSDALREAADRIEALEKVAEVARRVFPYVNDEHLTMCESLGYREEGMEPDPCDCGQEKRAEIKAAGLAALDTENSQSSVSEEK